jgi:hypothetical protein
MTLGKPDAGKPPVRFDEGWNETVFGLVPLNPSVPPTLLNTRKGMPGRNWKTSPYKFGVYRPSGFKEYGPALPAWKQVNFQPQIPWPAQME